MVSTSEAEGAANSRDDRGPPSPPPSSSLPPPPPLAAAALALTVKVTPSKVCSLLDGLVGEGTRSPSMEDEEEMGESRPPSPPPPKPA